jgi:hypothetical protein
VKFNELQIGVEYAVIPSWQYSSRDKKDPTQVRKSDVEKATLVNLVKYEYKVYRADNATHPEFVKAPQGSRSVGYLVTANNGTQDVYWLARPQDIVERWSLLEPRWADEARKEHEAREQLKREQEQRELERKMLQEQRARLETSTLDSLRSILGSRVDSTNLKFDTRSIRDNQGNFKEINIVQLDVALAQMLIEKVLEAKDLVG